MRPTQLVKDLIYLDRDFIADLFEATNGESPSTTITKNQSTKAGARIPVFSAEVSAQETRSYKVSSFEMLMETWDTLDAEGMIDAERCTSGMKSQYGWVEGHLTASRARSLVKKADGMSEVLSETEYFFIRRSATLAFPLVTTPEYFSSGLGTLVKLQQTVLKEMSVPVRAYVRVIAAHDPQKYWVAVPLVIVETEIDAE